MNKGNPRQLELFSHPSEGARDNTLCDDSFFGYIRGYEKAILLIIGLIFTGSVFFFLGVEKGKENVAFSVQERTPKLSVPVVIPENISEPEDINRAEAVRQEAEEKKKESPFNYTIQVATFANKSRANKEILFLKGRGITARVLKKGGYNIICVGNFPKKDMAKSLLTELKKKYHDGFIRKL